MPKSEGVQKLVLDGSGAVASDSECELLSSPALPAHVGAAATRFADGDVVPVAARLRTDRQTSSGGIHLETRKQRIKVLMMMKAAKLGWTGAGK